MPEDTLVLLLDHLAWPLICCGFLDQGRSRQGAALVEARRLSHPLTLAHALSWACILGWFSRAEPAELLRYADELLALSIERGFPLARALALVARGWSLVALGQAHQGLALLIAGLADSRATGSIWAELGALHWTADALGIAGQPQAALMHLAEAERIAADGKFGLGSLWMRGHLLTLADDCAAAEGCFRDAIAVAQRQGAKLFELRAATSLARLWCDRSRRTEARDLLAPIYAWFTEGFDTPDLRDAKALLRELEYLDL